MFLCSDQRVALEVPKCFLLPLIKIAFFCFSEYIVAKKLNDNFN